jgi:glycosyltransferase involved in cell wall biosynthesis
MPAPAQAAPLYIDVTRLVGRALKGRLPTGVDRVGLAYVKHFRARAGAVVRLGDRALALTSRDAQPLFDILADDPRRVRLVRALARALVRARGERILRGAILLNTGHSGLERHAYPEQLRRQQVKPIFVLHDLIPLTHPEYCRPGEDARHATRMDNLLATAGGVIANSRATLDDLSHYAGCKAVPVPPAIAAHLAAAPLPAPHARRPLAEPYFVMLGTIEPRKNHVMLLQVWRTLVQRYGLAAPRLVVIGQRGWECENAVDLLERCPALQEAVTQRHGCTDAELATWLHHAQALLFPSFAEGYGMPLAEALACGVPVIASDLPAFREIATDVPDYLDPLDGPGWCERVLAYTAPDSPARCAQIERMRDFAAPTWAHHFEQVEALMDCVA